jgi:hypothetical protein
MKYTTIRIEGSILSSDILDKIEQGNIPGQSPDKFGFDSKVKVKDEIAKAWADAQDMWRIYKRQIEKLPSDASGTSETRKYWIVPLLGLLGYDAELEKLAETLDNKTYAISHRVQKLDGFPVHIMGFNDSLDKKRLHGGPRMSPHALVQEYLNLTEHLYAIVTNGIQLRLLRDSSRLIKLSFLEFDLYTMMEEEHFADFAIMFRLLHVSRMPVKQGEGSESLIESYHQDALESGSRIRAGLSKAVEKSIISLGEGFLANSRNTLLRERFDNNEMSSLEYYQYILRLIYRLLFLMVIEERDLIYPKGADKKKRDIYYNYYSVEHLRKICEKRFLADKKYDDLWISLKNNFNLFENEKNGKHLDLKPLAGDLFGYRAIGILNECDIDNKVLLECLRNLSVFYNKDSGQPMRINYGSLNVEEFGSVYEGLLEYAPVVKKEDGIYIFKFEKGTERSSSGSHYTPDELVQPLIKHSLDYIIEDKLKENTPEQALLSIKVCDVACGSGHILLNAARRIATELAKIRTGEDQPSPEAFHKAVRDVIRNCIYGVDKNPLAVELCKVALWLEAHNPGEPLNFLDHHIKCGDAIVGLAHKEELENGIADEAFKKLPGDDDTAAKLSKQNKFQKKKKALLNDYFLKVLHSVNDVSKTFNDFNNLPENTPEEIEYKHNEYEKLISGENWWRLKVLADIQVAQFFIPKTEDNESKLITDAEYTHFLAGKQLVGQGVAEAIAVSQKKKFFHWFLEFPEVFAKGGFDCILGNPPYLGGSKISGNYGIHFLNYLYINYYPAGGQADYVAYFLRRIYDVLKRDGFLAIITTNTIGQSETREGGLEVINKSGGNIIFAILSIRWPGIANLFVSEISIIKGEWKKTKVINSIIVKQINTDLTDLEISGQPFKLIQNKNHFFKGIDFGGEGFLIETKKANEFIEADPKNKEVIFPILNGQEINNNPEQSPNRFIINFFDWNEQKAREYSLPFKHLEENVKPIRKKNNREIYRTKWWVYTERRVSLYKKLDSLKFCFVLARVTKYINFSLLSTNLLYTDSLFIFTKEKFLEFTIIQSTIHEEWARKYSSALANTLRYAPTDCFETFGFPLNLSTEFENELEKIGRKYHEFRKQLMLKIQLGLTKTYNLFHTKDLTIDEVIKESKQTLEISKEVFNDILKFRELHKEMDNNVLIAYGWEDLDLAHDFYEVDYLPENDRVRYTISPESRKEILKRLLLLNHEIHEKEERGEIINSILNNGKEIMNDELLAMDEKRKPLQQSLFDEPEQISMFDT